MPTLFVPCETRPGETRVAAVPETVKRFVKAGLVVQIEPGAGRGARIPDKDYEAAGAVLADRSAMGQADLVAKVQPPSEEECGLISPQAVLVSFAWPAWNPDAVERAKARGFAWLAMDLVPRISRAQAMDALSSQATVAGYKAVLLAATHVPRMFPLLMTAAGTVPPARVVVFGAGVAGLQAIATARRLGCVVEATDVRLAAKEQVQSLGARFIEVPGAGDMEGSGGYAKEQSEDFLRRQREEVAKRVAEANVVITTALVPGKKAPVLVDEAMVRSMAPGSVIVDLAVEAGGNCALAEKGQVVERFGVTIVGIPDLPTTVPMHASDLYSKNVFALSKLMLAKDGSLSRAFEDEVLAGCLLVANGELRHGQAAPKKEGEGVKS